MSSSPQKKPTLDQAFAVINEELLKTFIKKHKDYGKGNILAIKELGIAMRITEKSQRLINLLTSDKTPENESIDDTWTDIAVYANVAQLYRSGEFEALELDEEV
jgi:hypothetical protein